MHTARWALVAIAALPLAATAQTSDEKAAMATDEAFYQASLTEKGNAWRDFAAADAALSAGTGKDAIGAF